MRPYEELVAASPMADAGAGGDTLAGLFYSVRAVVVPREDATLTAEAVIEHCRTHVVGYKCPRSVGFRDRPLPLSGAGKVLKRELREPFWKVDQPTFPTADETAPREPSDDIG